MNQYLNNKEIQSYLSEFIEIFEKRPIKDNKGGMGFNHSFGLFVILKSWYKKYLRIWNLERQLLHG